MPSEREYRAARETYDPRRKGKRVDTLWIAESPPASGGYFYFPKTSKQGSLFRETVRALDWWPEEERMSFGMEKAALLERFRDHGYFLVDLAQAPVDKFSESDRLMALRRGVPPIVSQLDGLDPKAILLVSRRVFEVLGPKLKDTPFGSRVLNDEVIPFPGSGQQRRYRELVRRYLRIRA